MQKPRPTYANVMSTVAVFLALGGTSYAVAKLPKGSVGARELGTGAVTTAKLARGAVTGESVKDGSIGGADLAAGALVPGPRGPRGAQGPAGSNGTNGASAGETLLGAGPANATFANLQLAADVFTPIGSVTVPAGAWNFDAQTRLQFDPSGVEANGVWANCDLVTAAGERVSQTSAHVGDVPEAAITQVVSITAAATYPAATKLTLGCTHQETLTEPIAAVQTTLRATRVIRVDQQ